MLEKEENVISDKTPASPPTIPPLYAGLVLGWGWGRCKVSNFSRVPSILHELGLSSVFFCPIPSP